MKFVSSSEGVANWPAGGGAAKPNVLPLFKACELELMGWSLVILFFSLSSPSSIWVEIEIKFA